jgi:hypothetical protein
MKKEVFTSAEMPFDQIQRVQALPVHRMNPDGRGVFTDHYIVEEFRQRGKEPPRKVNPEEFEKEYRSIHRLSYGEAFEALKKGLKISYEDWENIREYLQISQQFEDVGQENPKIILWRIGVTRVCARLGL